MPIDNLFDILFLALPLFPSLTIIPYIQDYNAVHTIGISIAIAVSAFVMTTSLVPVVSEYTLKRGLCGKDLGKKGTMSESKDIPEV